MDKREEKAELEAEGITEEELEKIKEGEIEEPVFPYMVFTAAIIKDLIDIVELFGIVTLGLIGTTINIFMAPIIYTYVAKNLSLSKKKLYKRLIGKALAEFIPILSSFSFWTFFVWRAYKGEKRRMEKAINFLEANKA